MVTVSAPRSIILPSYSCLRRGLPGLLLALSERVCVSIESAEAETIKPVKYKQQISSILEHFPAYSKNSTPWAISVDSSFGFEDEFGFTSALTVGLVGALSYANKKLWNPMTIHQTAFDIMKTKSDIADAQSTVAAFGGVIWYRKELSYLSSLWQLPVKIKPEFQNFFLQYSQASTEQKDTMSDFQIETWIKSFAENLKKSDNHRIENLLAEKKLIPTVKLKNQVMYLRFGNSKYFASTKPIQIGAEGIRLEKEKL